MFCTLSDHEAGFKDLDVTYRSGKTETVRLLAPSRRQLREARIGILQDPDPWQIVRLAVPERDETWMDRLTSDSADRVESVVFALAFGDAWEKKMESATAQAAASVIPSEKAAPN
jgi:hypothetical protein